MYEPTQFIDKLAFWKGFQDFRRGIVITSLTDFDKKREWQRGFNYAYFQCLKRTQEREGYRRVFLKTLTERD